MKNDVVTPGSNIAGMLCSQVLGLYYLVGSEANKVMLMNMAQHQLVTAANFIHLSNIRETADHINWRVNTA